MVDMVVLAKSDKELVVVKDFLIEDGILNAFTVDIARGGDKCIKKYSDGGVEVIEK